MMRNIKIGLFYILLGVVFTFPFLPVSADAGPKPSMDFTFKQAVPGQAITIISGTLFECELADCLDAKPLLQMGPQHFSCDSSRCSALAYGFSPYHQLEIQFSDGKVRKSNVFTKDQFQAKFLVTIQEDDLVVKSTFHLDIFTPLTYVLLCSGCLLGIVLIIVVIVLFIRRSKRNK
jgi:hypothetical protein